MGRWRFESFLDTESESAEFSSVLANEAAFALEIGDRSPGDF